MIPTLSLRNIPNIGSVQGVVAVVFQDNYVQDALESDRGVIYERHSRAHLSDAFLIYHQLKRTGEIGDRTLCWYLKNVGRRFEGKLIHLQEAFTQ